MHGFRDVDHYWTSAASGPWLEHIRVPTLVINARNDPFLPEPALVAATRKAARLRDAGIAAHRRPRRLPRRVARAQRLHAVLPRMSVPAEIFRAYDIRGVVGRTLTPAIVREIGRALGSLARERDAADASPSAATAASPAPSSPARSPRA